MAIFLTEMKLEEERKIALLSQEGRAIAFLAMAREVVP
jgi:hypothetical protein